MAANTLDKLYFRFASRLWRMSELYRIESGAVELHPERRDGRLFCVVRLQHLWGEFCRELITRSSIGGARTMEGTRLPRVSGVRQWKDVEKIARETTGRRLDVPWHIPEQSARIALKLAPKNATQIVTALSSVSPIDEIRAIRNYVVHPNLDTRVKYGAAARRAGALDPDPDPDILLTTKVYPGNVTRFEYWAAQIRIVALDASR